MRSLRTVQGSKRGSAIEDLHSRDKGGVDQGDIL